MVEFPCQHFPKLFFGTEVHHPEMGPIRRRTALYAVFLRACSKVCWGYVYSVIEKKKPLGEEGRQVGD